MRLHCAARHRLFKLDGIGNEAKTWTRARGAALRSWVRALLDALPTTPAVVGRIVGPADALATRASPFCAMAVHGVLPVMHPLCI